MLEVHVRAGKAAPRCSCCGRKRRGYGRGGGVRRWRHRDFGCWRVGLVAVMPRVDCPGCGVVVASVPWAEPGSSRNSCAVCSDARSDEPGAN
ncbi:transposase family protein [Bifidobacterium breve]|uniref:transposase family protein n=1 Tax=Bifidobacterium breve TaxID=1685 RepID=UPI0029C44857|nr:transposase family protein [Bifidobacterium breve]MDX5149716.1 transposase family protein [Bifidobacterium breve]